MGLCYVDKLPGWRSLITVAEAGCRLQVSDKYDEKYEFLTIMGWRISRSARLLEKDPPVNR